MVGMLHPVQLQYSRVDIPPRNTEEWHSLIEPLESQNLSQLPYDIYDNIAIMREAVEDADHQSFQSEISKFPLDSEKGLCI